MTKRKTPEPVWSSKQTALQRILTTTVNALGMDATVAIMNQPKGPLVSQVSKGFSAREIRAVVRTLYGGNGRPEGLLGSDGQDEGDGTIELRMVTPSSKNLLAKLLREGKVTYGALVVGKQERRPFTKREKTAIDATGQRITEQLREAKLFDHSVLLARPWILEEPSIEGPAETGDATTRTYTSPQVQKRVAECLTEVQSLVPFDRGWVTLYDPLAASLEVLGCLAGHKKELLPGHRLSLNESASGWTVRHRKLRIDQNLASTQGRFQDYKQLYRDRFRCTLVVPFFVRGRVAGTITLASKTTAQYEHTEAESRKLASVTTQLAQVFDDPSLNLQVSSGAAAPSTPAAAAGVSEPVIRRQERQAALNEVSSFLATEIREPMGYIRAQLEEVTGDGTLDFEPQTSIEAAMRDLMRMESMLNDILDFAKPLQLDRRPCRVTALIEDGLALVATDLRINRIEVTKEFPSRLSQVRWDREKIQHVFLSIFTNALEAMSPGGNLRISVSQRRGRQPEMVIRIHNDGAPIPEELSEKIFEPYFTTKRSGTGLGLAMVKKIVDEHEGHIAVDSRPQEGTLVTITLPAMRPYRGQGRPSRRH
jgi:signal transduction histidine kinase